MPLWILWLSLLLPLNAIPSNQKVQLYQQALKLEKKAKYKEAALLWSRLVVLFRKEQQTHPALSRARNQLLLGECNVLFRLAETEWKAGNKWRSCRTREQLEKARKRIAARWLRFVSDTSLPKRFLASQKILRTTCKALPSRVVVSLQPKGASLSYQPIQSKKQSWQDAKGRVLKLSQGKWRLRVRSKGFVTQLKEVEVPLWQELRLSIVLQPKPTPVRRVAPKARVALRPPPLRRPLVPPKPQPPFYTTWWFWTATGVVVFGGSAALIIAVATAPVEPSLTFDPNNPAKIPFATDPK